MLYLQSIYQEFDSHSTKRIATCNNEQGATIDKPEMEKMLLTFLVSFYFYQSGNDTVILNYLFIRHVR